LPALGLAWRLDQWDREALGWNTVIIATVQLLDPGRAQHSLAVFRNWCDVHAVRLVTCRLPQNRLAECAFLEANGFRFIELSYAPTLTPLDSFQPDPALSIEIASAADLDAIGPVTDAIRTGRFHADPYIEAGAGERRYAAWLPNALTNPAQTVLKFMEAGQIVAVMVTEAPAPHRRFWSLGLLTGPPRPRLGTRVWCTLLAAHHRDGATEVSTRISSLNVAAHNLYAKLGFRFPAPSITLHWCPGASTSPHAARDDGVGVGDVKQVMANGECSVREDGAGQFTIGLP